MKRRYRRGCLFTTCLRKHLGESFWSGSSATALQDSDLIVCSLFSSLASISISQVAQSSPRNNQTVRRTVRAWFLCWQRIRTQKDPQHCANQHTDWFNLIGRHLLTPPVRRQRCKTKFKNDIINCWKMPLKVAACPRLHATNRAKSFPAPDL